MGVGSWAFFRLHRKAPRPALSGGASQCIHQAGHAQYRRRRLVGLSGFFRPEYVKADRWYAVVAVLTLRLG